MTPTEKSTTDKVAPGHAATPHRADPIPGPPAPDPGATRRLGAPIPPPNSAEEIRQKSEASGPIPPPPRQDDDDARKKQATAARHDPESQVALDLGGTGGDYVIREMPGDNPTRAREHRIEIDGQLYEHVGFHEGLWAFRKL